MRSGADEKEIVGISFARPISTLTTHSQRSPEKHRQLMRFNVEKTVDPISSTAMQKKSRKTDKKESNQEDFTKKLQELKETLNGLKSNLKSSARHPSECRHQPSEHSMKLAKGQGQSSHRNVRL